MLQKPHTLPYMVLLASGLAIGITISAAQQMRKFSPDNFELRHDISVSATRHSDDLGDKYGAEGRDKPTHPVLGSVRDTTFKYSMEIDPAAKQVLGEQTFNEVKAFFLTAEKAIEAKDLETIMALYSNNYRDGELDKKSVELAWRKIFARMDKMASLHNMKLARMSPDRNMVVFQCSGLLLGTPGSDKGYTTIDNWNNQDHILIKEDGKWKLIATYGIERQRLWFDKPMHPLF